MKKVIYKSTAIQFIILLVAVIVLSTTLAATPVEEGCDTFGYSGNLEPVQKQ